MRPDNLASMGDCPMLTLRPTGLSSPAYRDWLDYVIVEDGRDVGDRHNRPGEIANLTWEGSSSRRFWSKQAWPKQGWCKSMRDAVSLRAALPGDFVSAFVQQRWHG
jgi:hypothetical protein